MPGLELGIFVGETIDPLLQLDQPPDGEPVAVVLRLGALKMEQRGLVLAAVVEEIGEVDARLGVLRLELQGPP